jgi:hypothetical protein
MQATYSVIPVPRNKEFDIKAQKGEPELNLEHISEDRRIT